MMAINNMIRKHGARDEIFGKTQYAQIPMAVVGIVMKFFQIVISVVIGMAAGCIPIVGFNMGAKEHGRVKELFTKLLCAESAVGIAALIIAEVFPRTLIQIFGAANESVYYTDFAVKSFRIYLCMVVLACINKATFIFIVVCDVQTQFLCPVNSICISTHKMWIFQFNGLLGDRIIEMYVVAHFSISFRPFFFLFNHIVCTKVCSSDSSAFIRIRPLSNRSACISTTSISRSSYAAYITPSILMS